MKRLIPILLLAGCSSGATSGETSTLVSLLENSTTVAQTLPSETPQYTALQFAFFDDVVYYYGQTPVMSDDTMLEYAELWCQLMDDGMTGQDVVERINEGGINNDDRRLHFSIVTSAIGTLCRSHADEAEYIALNTPTP